MMSRYSIRYYILFIYILILLQAEDEKMEVPEKKAWSNLHGAWGKRPAKQANYNSGK